jgi:hypothetical protein
MKVTWEDWRKNPGTPEDPRRWARDTAADSDVAATLYLDPNNDDPARATGWFASVYVVGWDSLDVEIRRSIELVQGAALANDAKLYADAFAAGVVTGIEREIEAGGDVTDIK